jgi:hypothetical protein
MGKLVRSDIYRLHQLAGMVKEKTIIAARRWVSQELYPSDGLRAIRCTSFRQVATISHGNACSVAAFGLPKGGISPWN